VTTDGRRLSPRSGRLDRRATLDHERARASELSANLDPAILADDHGYFAFRMISTTRQRFRFDQAASPDAHRVAQLGAVSSPCAATVLVRLICCRKSVRKATLQWRPSRVFCILSLTTTPVRTLRRPRATAPSADALSFKMVLIRAMSANRPQLQRVRDDRRAAELEPEPLLGQPASFCDSSVRLELAQPVGPVFAFAGILRSSRFTKLRSDRAASRTRVPAPLRADASSILPAGT